MQESKLITILKTLTTDEFYKFHEFVISPFYNKNKNITLLFNFIKKYYPKFSNNNFTKEKGFLFVFPNEKYNDSKLRVLMAKLLTLLEDYLALLENKEDEYINGIKVLRSLRLRKIDKYFENYLNSAKKKIEAYPYRNFKYFFYSHELENEIYHSSYFRGKPSFHHSLQRLCDQLDLFYLIKKLCYSAEMNFREYFQPARYKKPFLTGIVRFLKKLEKTSKKELNELYPTISIYYLTLLIFAEKDNYSNYIKLKNMLSKHSTLFPGTEAYYLYFILTNYLYVKLEIEQNEKYLHEIFDIHKTLVKTGLILRRGVIDTTDFNNVISIAVALKQYKWVEDFIKKFKFKLPVKDRHNTLNLAFVMIFFGKKQYDEALMCISKINSGNYFNYLTSRIMLSKIYYETDEIEGLFSFFDSFRHYITRNKMLSKVIKKKFLNYNSYLYKLFRIKIGKKDNLEEVRSAIIGNKLIADKEWLMEKIIDLSGNLSQKNAG